MSDVPETYLFSGHLMFTVYRSKSSISINLTAGSFYEIEFLLSFSLLHWQKNEPAAVLIHFNFMNPLVVCFMLHHVKKIPLGLLLMVAMNDPHMNVFLYTDIFYWILAYSCRSTSLPGRSILFDLNFATQYPSQVSN